MNTNMFVKFLTFEKQQIYRKTLINWIIKAWESKNSIKPENVKHSFMFCGISNKVNGSENDLFKEFDKLSK